MRNIALLLFLSLILVTQIQAKEPRAEKLTAITKIMPHRAVYAVKLKSAKEESNIEDTNGKMVIELKQDCNGWTLKQDSASVIDVKSMPTEIMRSLYVAWESNDGKHLKFHTERIYNESIKDTVGGSAGFNKQGGFIIYTTPQTTRVNMKPGTLPPIAHMKKLLESAQSGESTVSQQVFDGSFFGNPVQINTFIGKKKGTCSASLANEPVWPMNLAIYAMPSVLATPNFEITQAIASNGVMCSYTIDFGDYSVQGTLEKLEYLPESVCGGG